MENATMIQRKIGYHGREISYFEFEHHRWSLAAWKCDRDRNGGTTAAVITIDRHRDFVLVEKERLEAFARYHDHPSFETNVRDIPVPGNYDFIPFAFSEDLCSDVVSVSYEHYYDAEVRNMVQPNTPVAGRGGSSHRLFVVPTLTDLFSPQGAFDPEGHYPDCARAIESANALILDIDLDYFSYQSPDDGVFARDPKDIERVFERSADGMKKMLSKVRTIAVARETICCGGHDAMLAIKDQLHKMFLKYLDIDIPLL